MKENMKAKAMNTFLICRTHCDLIYSLTVNLKALFMFNARKPVVISKERAVTLLNDIQDSVNELRREIEDMEEL